MASKTSVSLVHSRSAAADMLNSAYNILRSQLQLMEARTAEGDSFAPAEINALNRLVQSLVALSKEERAQELHNDYGDLKDTDLAKLVAKAQKVLQIGDGDA